MMASRTLIPWLLIKKRLS